MAHTVLKTNNQLVQQQMLFLQLGYMITEITENNEIKSVPRKIIQFGVNNYFLKI